MLDLFDAAPSGPKPTPEQALAVVAFAEGGTLRITAFAGAGKTSTLRKMSNATKKRGLYAAFNRAIAEEAKTKFPSSVVCKTLHAVAFGALVDRYGSNKIIGALNGGLLAETFGLKDMDTGKLALTSRGFGGLVAETVARWCRSSRDAIGERDVPTVDAFAGLDDGTLSPVKREIVRLATEAWSRMIDPAAKLPLTFDGSLKVFALGKPDLPGEAQDLNGVVVELLRHQKAQLVAVGDGHQQLYQWRGAVDALRKLPADRDLRLTQSFRFGAAIAEQANIALRLLGETVPLVGNPNVISIVGPIARPNAIIARSNVTAIEHLFAAIERGERPALIGGIAEILGVIAVAETLMADKPTSHPVFLGFRSWREVCAVAEEVDDTNLKRWVAIISVHGTGRLREMLQSLPSSKDATLVVATGHKSKGLEWHRVRLADDFLKANPDTDISADIRLYYVALTRAKLALEIHQAVLDRLKAIVEKRTNTRAGVVEAVDPSPGSQASLRSSWALQVPTSPHRK